MKLLQIAILLVGLALPAAQAAVTNVVDQNWIVEIERPRILAKAAKYLKEEPVTVTAATCERSAGGRHDFFSEGDYWWPDPQNPDGPYIQRDGLSNTNNFVAHRHAMVRLSEIIGTLGSAWVLTGEDKYVQHAVKHLRAWFVNENTKMNPTLLYSQAIKGRFTGRSIGVIDTLHLVEVARGAFVLQQSPAFSKKDQDDVKAWFRSYLTWMNTHPYGVDERKAGNNHAICWFTQAAAFAQLVGDEKELATDREHFKTVFLEKHMAADGSFPAELRRTKPFGYSLFVIDAMAGIAQAASTPQDDLWTYTLPDGRGMKKGLEFIFPFIEDKSRWTNRQDVLYWNEWPVRHPSVLFAGLKFNQPQYLKTWQKLEPDPKVDEVVRNVPIRHPLLWVGPMKPVKGR